MQTFTHRGKMSSKLTIHSVKPKHFGKFSCVASTRNGIQTAMVFSVSQGGKKDLKPFFNSYIFPFHAVGLKFFWSLKSFTTEASDYVFHCRPAIIKYLLFVLLFRFFEL